MRSPPPGGGRSGQIAVAAYNMGIPTVAAPMVQHPRVEEPDLHIEVQHAPSPAALRLLRQGAVDIAPDLP